MNAAAADHSSPASGPRPSTRSEHPGDTWRIAPGWRGRFEALGPIDWFDLDHEPRASLIKANPRRRVFRVRTEAAALFVKVFRADGWADRLRWLLRGSDAQNEWNRGCFALAHEVRCVPVVAYGRRPRGPGGGQAVLITEEVEDAVPLAEAWRRLAAIPSAPERSRAIQGLTEALAALLADAHARRFVHRDGHPGNILVRESAERVPEACYVDLYGARIDRPVDDEQAASSIAHLDLWFSRHASRTERLRFLRHYLARRTSVQALTDTALRRWLAAVRVAREAQQWRLFKHRDRRLARQGVYFATTPLAKGWKARLALRLRSRDEFPAAIHPHRELKDWRQWLRQHPPGTLPTAPPEQCEVRHRPAAGFTERWHWTWRGAPAVHAFCAGHRLRHRDLPAACPMAVLAHHAQGLVDQTLLLVEKRPDVRPLGHWLAVATSAAERAQVLAGLGRLLADLGRRGVRWKRPRPDALGVEVHRGVPRVLIIDFDGFSFGSAPLRDPTATVEQFLAALQRCQSIGPADGRAVLTAFGRHFGAVPLTGALFRELTGAEPAGG